VRACPVWLVALAGEVYLTCPVWRCGAAGLYLASGSELFEWDRAVRYYGSALWVSGRNGGGLLYFPPALAFTLAFKRF
jgi:hypothetical protein